MKTFTIHEIRSWSPCYDPKKYLPEDWSGTAVDILQHPEIPPQDKVWVVCREDLISAKTLRLFAVWCARQVEHLLTDDRSKNAIDVAERFANGEATEQELAAAGDAARVAARAAAWDAARGAARDAAWAAARDAARGAARGAAWDAARGAAWDAAWDAAWAAAWDAAWAAQIKKLIEMVEAETK